VVSSDKCNTIRIAHFESQQQQKGLYRVIPSVNKITQKEIVFIGALSTNFEEFYKVIKLAMDITTYLKQVPKTKSSHG